MGALRLQRATDLKPGNLVGHLHILAEFHRSQEFMNMSDLMNKQLNFDKPYKVVITDRGTWSSGGPLLDRGSMVWYTDGSKMNNGVGVGVYGPRCRLSKSLGKSPTIFQAETHAIELCAKRCIEKRIRSANIIIMSDSQAALKALDSYSFESKLVWECSSSLKQLARSNRVTLMWVPGHEGISGNEIADELARAGAEQPFIGPEPFCGTSRSHLMEELREWENDVKNNYWNNIPGIRQGKRFLAFSKKKAKEVLTLSKTELRTLTGLFTGHCPLRYHLNKIGKSDNRVCRFCSDDDETAEHILCDCEAVARKRLTHLGRGFLSPHEIRGLAVRKILGFYGSLGID